MYLALFVSLYNSKQMTNNNQTIPHSVLLRKCDYNIVDQIMSYHGEYNYWKEKYSFTLVHIKKLYAYCYDDIVMRISGDKGTLLICVDALFDDDCSMEEDIYIFLNTEKYVHITYIEWI